MTARTSAHASLPAARDAALRRTATDDPGAFAAPAGHMAGAAQRMGAGAVEGSAAAPNARMPPELAAALPIISALFDRALGKRGVCAHLVTAGHRMNARVYVSTCFAS